MYATFEDQDAVVHRVPLIQQRTSSLPRRASRTACERTVRRKRRHAAAQQDPTIVTCVLCLGTTD